MITKFEFVKGSVYEDPMGNNLTVTEYDAHKEFVSLESEHDVLKGHSEAVAEEMTKRQMVCIFKPCCCTC